MSTATIEEEKVLESDTPPDQERHYFKKSDLDENLFNGKIIVAMCGFKKEGLATPDIELPTCKRCNELMEMFFPPSND